MAGCGSGGGIKSFPRPLRTRGKDLLHTAVVGGGGGAKLVERPLLDLPDALGAETQAPANLAERLRRATHTVMSVEDRALALVEPVHQGADLLRHQLLDDPLVLVLR